jgi:uncharacterized protein (TIGR02246 family)
VSRRSSARTLLRLAAAAALLAGCRAGAPAGGAAPAKVRAEIEARDRSLEAAQLRGDAAAVAEHYAPEATIYATGGGRDLRGRAAIEASFAQLYGAMAVEAASLRTTALRARADSLVEESGRFTFQFRGRDGAVTCERGQYTATWRRGPDGIWRVVADRSGYDAVGAAGPCAPTG